MRSPPRAQQYVRWSHLVGGETNAAIKTTPGLPARLVRGSMETLQPGDAVLCDAERADYRAEFGRGH
jgi:hypothetical protein